MSYDNACKYLAEQYPVEFVNWLLAVESKDIEVLKTELTLEPIRADAIAFLRTANQILHIEFQTSLDPCRNTWRLKIAATQTKSAAGALVRTDLLVNPRRRVLFV